MFCWVPRNVMVLDTGCGFGESLDYHQTQAVMSMAVEADENIHRVAKGYCAGACK